MEDTQSKNFSQERRGRERRERHCEEGPGGGAVFGIERMKVREGVRKGEREIIIS